MKKKIFFVFFGAVIANCNITQNTHSDNCEIAKYNVMKLINETDKINHELNCIKIESLLKEKPLCFENDYKVGEKLIDLSNRLFSFNNENKYIFQFKKKGITMRGGSIFTLASLSSLYYKDNYPKRYNELEFCSDSVFIAQNITNKINLELSFILRSMIKKDQSIRNRHLFADKINDKKLADSLMKKMKFVDSINEILLSEIFDYYGYPGLSLIGSSTGSTETLVHHMSPNFQKKYISLMYQAIKNKQVFGDISFLIDKVLYSNYKKTIYGTHWSNSVPESNLDTIRYYKSLINIQD